MSDVVYRPNDSAAPARAEAPVDRRQRIDNPIEGGSEADRISASVRELNKKREREGTAGEIPEPTPLHYEDKAQKTLRQVSKDVSDYHRVAPQGSLLCC
jgi:hypothetical protein